MAKRIITDKPTTVDEVIQLHALKGEQIYENRTAGDHTWVGYLADFLMKIEDVTGQKILVQGECSHKCLPTREALLPNARHFLDCPVWKYLGVG